MSSVNVVMLVGNLAADPEIKPTSQGSRIARMRLITSESYRTQDGNRKETSHGHNVVVFNERLVDVIESYARKGQKIYVQGKLENRTWTDSDEVKHYETEVVLARYGGEFRMLGGNSGEDRGEGGQRDREDRNSTDNDRGGNRRENTRNDSRGSDNRGNDSRRDDRKDDRNDNHQQNNNRNDDYDDDIPF